MRKSRVMPAMAQSNASRARGASAGMYLLPSDPIGARRHFGGDKRTGLFHSMPFNPSQPIYAYSHPFYFKNAYDVDTSNVWDEANTGSGTVLTVQDARGGKAKATNGSAENDFYTYFSKYEIAKLAAGKDLWFYTSMQIGDVSEADWFVGLCTTLGSGNLFDDRVDSIGFYGADGSANINVECRKDGTPTQSTAVDTIADGIEKWVGFHVISTTEVVFFTATSGDRDSFRAAVLSNLPDDEEMCIAFGCRNGTTSGNTLQMSTIWVIQDR